ncbi:cytochrome P450 [Poronia punctata]|nr:cytochrome P450 [Poronia punctata]
MTLRASLALFATFLVVVLLGVTARRRFFHPLSRFPGPFWGSVTTLYQVYHYVRGSQGQSQRELHQRYGPVVRFGPSHLIISDPTMLPEIYHMKTNKSDFYNSSLNEASQTVFSEKHNVAHIAARRSLAHVYSMANVKGMEPQIQELIDKWVTRLCTHEEKPFAIRDRALWLAFDVLGIMAFGEPFGFVEEWTDIRTMLERASKSTTSGAYLEIINRIPVLSRLATGTRLGRWLLLPSPTDKAGTGVLKAERDAAWAKYFERKPAGSDHCLLSQLLNKRTKLGQDALLSDDRIKAELLIALLAGTTTTAAIITSVLLNVADREQYRMKLSSEIIAAHERNGGTVSYELGRSLIYLGACVQEAFRLSAAPTQFPRLENSERELNGVRLPRGTILSSSSYIVARNEGLYGSQLDEFIPERWIDASEETKKARRKYDFRFGYGARTCLGKNLVEVEIHNAVFEVFRRTEVRVHNKAEGLVSLELRQYNRM